MVICGHCLITNHGFMRNVTAPYPSTAHSWRSEHGGRAKYYSSQRCRDTKTIQSSEPLKPALAFIDLITNPNCVRLRACKRCKAFFVAKQNRRNNWYCTRRCAAAATAEKAMRAARAKEMTGKLNAIRAAVNMGDKKAANMLTKEEITRNFLTRIVNAGKVKDIEEQVLTVRSRIYDRGRPSK